MNVPIICLCKIPQKLKCSRVRTIVYIEPKLLIPVSCEYANIQIKLEIMAETSSGSSQKKAKVDDYLASSSASSQIPGYLCQNS